MQYLIMGMLFLVCSSNAFAQCELRVNNLTDQPAFAWIQYEPQLTDQVDIAPHRSLFVDLFYDGYCHSSAYFKLYRNVHELYFSGVLVPGQIFDINP